MEEMRFTFVIGVGGCGFEVVGNVAEKVETMIADGYQDYTEFIEIDSASRLDNGTDLKGKIKYLNLLTPGLQYRINYRYRSDFIRKIIPEDFEIMKLNDHGSSIDRRIGKIKLYDYTCDRSSTNDVAFQKMIEEALEKKCVYRFTRRYSGSTG